MSDRWPNWTKGQTLHAWELRALESYLLTGDALRADSAHGVCWLDPSAALRIQPYQDKKGDGGYYLQVVVTGVSGLTPSGQPVSIEGARERHRLENPQPPVSALMPVTEQPERVDFQAWIDVGVEGSGDRKLRVRAVVCAPDAPAPGLEPTALYLGRFTWTDDKPESATLSGRPLVYSFDALRPWDGDWQRWTGELHHHLKTLHGEISELVADAPGALGISASQEATRLYAEWASLSWAELTRRWQRVNRLKKALQAGVLDASVPTETPTWNPSSADGELQPSQVVSHCHTQRAASKYHQWRLYDGTVIEGLLEDTYLEFWIVADQHLPRGRLHLTFAKNPPHRLEVGHKDTRFLSDALPVQGNPGMFNIHSLAHHLNHGTHAIVRGIGRADVTDLNFEMA